MLAQPRARAAEPGVELDLREGDMRELELGEPAALIYCPGRSLLHLPTEAFDAAASSALRRRFCLAVASPGTHSPSTITSRLPSTASPPTPKKACRCPTPTHYSVSEGRVDVTLDDGGTGSLWWATKNEWLGASRRRGPPPRSSLRRIQRRPARGRQRGVRLGFQSIDLQSTPSHLTISLERMSSRPDCRRKVRRQAVSVRVEDALVRWACRSNNGD